MPWANHFFKLQNQKKNLNKLHISKKLAQTASEASDTFRPSVGMWGLVSAVLQVGGRDATVSVRH